MTHIMLDIETLGLKPGCVVLSVAMVRLSDLASMSIVLNGEEQHKAGLVFSQDTWNWWQGQSPAARSAAFDNPQEVRAALGYIGQWLRWATEGAEPWHHIDSWFIWCHGASFDAPILAEVFERFEMPVPWQYNQVRDTRTLYDLAGVELSAFQAGERHIALNDAMCQAKAAVRALGLLDRGVVTRYFYHPESDCYLTTDDGSQPADPLVEEITGGEYLKGRKR